MQHIDIGLSMSILMAKHRVSMGDVEKGTKLSNSTLRNMKKGPLVGSIRNLEKVARFFKLGVVEFLQEGLHGKELEFKD